MSIRATLLALSLLTLSGCGTFYNNPSKSEPHAVFVEREDSTALIFPTLSARLAEIDGKPVSHMGGGGDQWEIRVEPGLRRVVFHLSFRATGSLAAGPSPWHRASVPLELKVEAGKRYRLYLEVKEHPYVTFSIVDLDKPDTAWLSLTTPTVRLLTGLSSFPNPQSIEFHVRP